VVDATLAQVVATSVDASSPAWDRLTEIAKEHTAGVAKGPSNRTAGLARHQARGGSPRPSSNLQAMALRSWPAFRRMVTIQCGTGAEDCSVLS
jgi:hypothetical protein